MNQETQDEMLQALQDATEQVKAGSLSQLMVLGVGPASEDVLFRLEGDMDERTTMATIGYLELVKRKFFDLLEAVDAELIDRALDADESNPQ